LSIKYLKAKNKKPKNGINGTAAENTRAIVNIVNEKAK